MVQILETVLQVVLVATCNTTGGFEAGGYGEQKLHNRWFRRNNDISQVALSFKKIPTDGLDGPQSSTGSSGSCEQFNR